jgi:hypothetical protein
MHANHHQQERRVPDIPISYPGKYAPGVALNFADSTGSAKQVSETSPLPVTLAATATSAPGPSALAGNATTAVTVGPYTPVAGKPLFVSLSGTWTGTVKLLRSVDGGTTRLPVTLAGAPWAAYSANVCEPVWEENEASAVFYLQLSPTSGSIAYRLAQ